VQIDHHRHEHAKLVPPQIPFVCIVQDNLPNLTASHVGPRLGATDFTAGPWAHKYVREFGYPASQCIEMPRLARAPTRGAHRRNAESRTILYVSNHSHTFDRSLANVVALFPPGPWQDFVRDAALEIKSVYDHGQCFEDASEIAALVQRRAERAGRSDLGALRPISEALATQINNPLYRQQGLAWAAQAATRLGLELIVHGTGWEHHPLFAPFARGPIAYGSDLIEATRCAAFCLMLEPFFPTSHQRSIDVWMCGGLVLIRRRRRDRQLNRFMSWLDRLPAHTCLLRDALEYLTGDELQQFRAVYAEQIAIGPYPKDIDLIALYRDLQQRDMEHLIRQPPHYDSITFDDARTLESVMSRLLVDSDHAARIAGAQYDWTRTRFSYHSGVEKLLARIRKALSC
jgi:hypothetical protein